MTPEQIQNLTSIVQSTAGAAYQAALVHAHVAANVQFTTALIFTALFGVTFIGLLFWTITDDEYDKTGHVMLCIPAFFLMCISFAYLTGAVVAQRTAEWTAVQDVAKLVVH